MEIGVTLRMVNAIKNEFVNAVGLEKKEIFILGNVLGMKIIYVQGVKRVRGMEIARTTVEHGLHWIMAVMASNRLSKVEKSIKYIGLSS